MKKIVRRCIWVISIVLCTALVYAGLDYFISDDTSSMSRITIHDFYETEQIDRLFVGPSHSMYAIDAPALSERTGKSVFSLTTAGMDHVQAYYLLKEVFRVKDVPEVFFEISPSRLKIRESNPTGTYLISDYLRSPLARAEMILETGEMESFLNGWFRLRRNIADLPTLSKIRETAAGKRSDRYLRCTDIGVAGFSYLGRGSWIQENDPGRDSIDSIYIGSRNMDHFTGEDIQQEQLDYLEKTMQLCEKKGTCLTCYVCPFSDPYLMNFRDYEQVMGEIGTLCAEYGVPLIDMNHVKKAYLQMDQEDFQDADHVTPSGSEKITEFLARYLSDPSGDYFCAELRDGELAGKIVAAVGYYRKYVCDAGEFSNTGDVSGRITALRVQIGAFPDTTVPVDVSVTRMRWEEETGQWIPDEPVSPVGTDGEFTEYLLPLGKEEIPYYVELREPGTGEVLCSARTMFNMI